MYQKFQEDNEYESLEKIQDSLEQHRYSDLEICDLKNEIQKMFFIEKKEQREERKDALLKKKKDEIKNFKTSNLSVCRRIYDTGSKQ